MIVKGHFAALSTSAGFVAELVNATLLHLSSTVQWLSMACRSICLHAMSHWIATRSTGFSAGGWGTVSRLFPSITDGTFSSIGVLGACQSSTSGCHWVVVTIATKQVAIVMVGSCWYCAVVFDGNYSWLYWRLGVGHCAILILLIWKWSKIEGEVGWFGSVIGHGRVDER